MKFPLKHPSYICADLQFEKYVRKVMGKNKLVKFFRKIEGKIRRIVIGVFEKVNKGEKV